MLVLCWVTEPVRLPVVVVPVSVVESAGNTAMPTSSSTEPLVVGSACSSARTPAFAQSSLSGVLLMPVTDALHELVIEPVVSRTTKMFIGFGNPCVPRAAAVDVAVTVKLGMKRLSSPVFTLADSLTYTSLQVVAPDGRVALEPLGWQLSPLVSVRQVGDEPEV